MSKHYQVLVGKKLLVIIFCIFTQISSFAFDPNADGVEPPPNTAPISDWIPYVVVMALFYALLIVLKNKTKVVQ